MDTRGKLYDQKHFKWPASMKEMCRSPSASTWSMLICCNAELHSKLTIWSTKRIHRGPLTCELVAKNQYRWNNLLTLHPLPMIEIKKSPAAILITILPFFPLLSSFLAQISAVQCICQFKLKVRSCTVLCFAETVLCVFFRCLILIRFFAQKVSLHSQ